MPQFNFIVKIIMFSFVLKIGSNLETVNIGLEMLLKGCKFDTKLTFLNLGKINLVKNSKLSGI